MRTEAIVFEGVGKVALREFEMPPPAPDEVQIRTLYSTISSGTEGWMLQNVFWTPTAFPCVPGYQRVGVIEKLGPGVTGWQIGDQVVATRSLWPGTEVRPQSGAHIALANTPISEVYALPAGVDLVDAAGTVVAQVGLNAATRAVLKPGDWVVVYGDGLIGQCAAQAARAQQARVILVGHRADRLSLAAQHSADIILNNLDENVVETVRQVTQGLYIAAVLDSVQTEAAQKEYMPLLERGHGQIVYCGFSPAQNWADMTALQKEQLTTHFIAGWTHERMERTLALMAAGKLKLRPLITHLVSYRQGPAMYQRILEKSGSMLGITLDWTDRQS